RREWSSRAGLARQLVRRCEIVGAGGMLRRAVNVQVSGGKGLPLFATTWDRQLTGRATCGGYIRRWRLAALCYLGVVAARKWYTKNPGSGRRTRRRAQLHQAQRGGSGSRDGV